MYRSELGTGKSGIASHKFEDDKPRNPDFLALQTKSTYKSTKSTLRKEEGKSAGGIYRRSAGGQREIR
jgi:hypothetical protein